MRACLVDGCDRDTVARNMCGKHYQRAAAGRPLVADWESGTELTVETIPRRCITNEDGCWIWQGSRVSTGYGNAQYKGKTALVHRISYALFKGDIPANSKLTQTCGNRLCVNPEHLAIKVPKPPRTRSPRPVYPSICIAPGCNSPSRTKGMCGRHDYRMRKYGSFIAPSDHTVEDRIRSIGWDTTAEGCWEWNGARNEHGYGMLTMSAYGLSHARAHRVAYEVFTGESAEGRIIRHKCDNPPCMNPDHLEPGTMADNTSDMMERGRHHLHGRTHCKNGHDVTAPESTKEVTKKGSRTYRSCVECDRDRKNRYAQKVRSRAS